MTSSSGTKQTLKLENRSVLSVNGITGLKEFSETEVVFESENVLLIVSGSGLCVTKLALETGESAVTGCIDAVVYSENAPKRSFFSRFAR